MKKLFIFLALLTFAFCLAAPLPGVADKHIPTDLFVDGEVVNVFVHISALEEGKNGLKVAKITRITLAQKGQKPEKNVLRARLRRNKNLLQFEIQMLNSGIDRFLMPKGFVINDRISKLLGSSKQVVMSGGSTMVRQKDGKGLLQFEIQ